MLTHLYTTYASITPAKLIENDARLKTAYDVNQPIKRRASLSMRSAEVMLAYVVYKCVSIWRVVMLA